MNIPDGWLLIDLADVIVDMQPGFAQRPNDRDEGARQLRTNNVSPEGEIDLSTVAYVNASTADLERYGVRRGDVIFNNTNSIEWVGKTAYFDEEGEYVLSNHMTRIRVNEHVLDAQFLAKYLHHLWRTGSSLRWAKHWVNQAAIDQSALSRYRIILPTLPEQRRIVGIMREADELRRLRGDAISKVGKLTSSIFDEILGNPASNSKDWPIEPLGRLIIDTPQNGLYKHSSSYGEGTPIVRITDFYEGRLNAPNTFNRLKATQDELDKYSLENGNVLINRVNSEEFLGKCALVEGLTEATLFESNMMRLVVDQGKVTPRYLSYFLNTNHARKQILIVAKRAVNQASINQQDVMNLRIPVPSWEAMKKFETTILAAYEIEQITIDSAKGINDLFKSILAQAFTGELTARWRGQHEAELIEAARERDALLSKSAVSGAARITGTSTLTAEATVVRLAPPEREDMVAALGRKQQRVLDLANSMEGYFTLPQLSQARHEASELSHADIRQGLQLLAALGLVMNVRVATEPMKNELFFTPAYRRLLPSQDDSRLRDLDRLGANGG